MNLESRWSVWRLINCNIIHVSLSFLLCVCLCLYTPVSFSACDCMSLPFFLILALLPRFSPRFLNISRCLCLILSLCLCPSLSLSIQVGCLQSLQVKNLFLIYCCNISALVENIPSTVEPCNKEQ